MDSCYPLMRDTFVELQGVSLQRIMQKAVIMIGITLMLDVYNDPIFQIFSIQIKLIYAYWNR